MSWSGDDEEEDMDDIPGAGFHLEELELDGLSSEEDVSVWDKSRMVTMTAGDARHLQNIRKRREANGAVSEAARAKKPIMLSAAESKILRAEKVDAAQEEEILQRYVFVEEELGDVDASARPAQQKKALKPRAPRTSGAVQKTPNVVVVDAHGKDYQAAEGGVVKINVGRQMLKPVMADDVSPGGRLFGLKDHSSKDLSTEHWECRVFSTSPDHKRFILVGKNTGNLQKHAQKDHEVHCDAIKRLIHDNPAQSALLMIEAYVASLSPEHLTGQTSLDRFFGRLLQSNISAECAAVMWFIDAQIPWNQFNNPLFYQFCRTLSSDQVSHLAGTTTIVETILPILYKYVMARMYEKMQRWNAFWNSFDAWARFGFSFVSQNYYGIDPKEFDYDVLLLDLIHFPFPKYSETLAGLLVFRQDIHTENMDPVPLRAGGTVDQAANVQAAGRLMYGPDDIQPCQDHVIGTIFDDVENESNLQFNFDTRGMASLALYVSQNWNVSKDLRDYQQSSGMLDLSVKLEHAIRWTGLFDCMSRMIELQESLHVLAVLEPVIKLGGAVDDFLKPSFFVRLEGYLSVLQPFRDATILYQTQKFPVGVFVPLISGHIRSEMEPNNMDAPYIVSLKRVCLRSVRSRMGPVLSQVNPFLMASVLHPGVCGALRDLGYVTDALINDAFTEIGEECGSLLSAKVTANSQRLRIAKEGIANSIDYYKTLTHLDGIVPEINILEIAKDGTYWGQNHMSFWKSVALGVNEDATYLAAMVPGVSMMLAAPASEAVDETVFSSTGGTFTKARSALGPHTLEQMTVIRMYVRRYGYTPYDLTHFITSARLAHDLIAPKVSE